MGGGACSLVALFGHFGDLMADSVDCRGLLLQTSPPLHDSQHEPSSSRPRRGTASAEPDALLYEPDTD